MKLNIENTVIGIHRLYTVSKNMYPNIAIVQYIAPILNKEIIVFNHDDSANDDREEPVR